MSDKELDATYTREVGGLAWHRTRESYIDRIVLARLDLPTKEPCKRHLPPLSYVGQIEKNEAMSKRGNKQLQCQKCGRWYWQDEV